MKLIVGLGNPGPSYRNTRHNIGFAVVAELSDRHHVRGRLRGPAVVGEAIISGQPVVLGQPVTFMNLSGRAVVSLRRSYNVRALEDLLVVCDDMDLPLGVIRLRERGSAGGHNGLKSIIESLGTDGFPRVRVGIGRPPPWEDPVEYVLKSFRPEERELAEVAVRMAADAAECWIENGATETMNHYNRLPESGVE